MNVVRNRVLAVIAIVAIVLPSVGCAIGNSAEVRHVRSVSVGQEMIDLKRAVDTGAISSQEYTDLKAQLMDLGDIDTIEFTDED